MNALAILRGEIACCVILWQPCLDRKNFLFVNTPRGAVGSAVMFSLIEKAKENGLNPYKYLTYIFHEAPNMDFNDTRQLESLLPWSATDEYKIPNAET